jgi:predicted RNA polymerase sigma factor
MKDHHRLEAVKAHLLEMSGDLDGARASYLLAARRTTSMPERDYLQKRAERIS